MKRYRHQNPSYTKLRRASGTPDWSSYGYTPQYKRGKRQHTVATPHLARLVASIPALEVDEAFVALMTAAQPHTREIQPGVWQYTFTYPEPGSQEEREMLERGPVTHTIERDEEG